MPEAIKNKAQNNTIKQTHRDALREIYGGHYVVRTVQYLEKEKILKANNQPYSSHHIGAIINNRQSNTLVAMSIIKMIQKKRIELIENQDI